MAAARYGWKASFGLQVKMSPFFQREKINALASALSLLVLTSGTIFIHFAVLFMHSQHIAKILWPAGAGRGLIGRSYNP